MIRSFNFYLTIIFALLLALTNMGCNASDRSTLVVDSRSGQLTQALNITFSPSTNSEWPAEEGTEVFIREGTIAALTSQVDLYEVTIQTSKPCGKLSWKMTFGDRLIEVGSSEVEVGEKKTTHVIRASNAGYLTNLLMEGDTKTFQLYADTRGLAGSEAVTFNIVSAKVKIALGAEQSLTVQNRGTSRFIAEQTKFELTKGVTSTTFTSVGTNDVWLSFSAKNLSSSKAITLNSFGLFSSSKKAEFYLADSNGSRLGTFTHTGNGFYSLSLFTNEQFDTPMSISAGQTKTFQIRGNPNGEKAIQILDFSVSAQSETKLYGHNSFIANQTVTYP